MPRLWEVMEKREQHPILQASRCRKLVKRFKRSWPEIKSEEESTCEPFCLSVFLNEKEESKVYVPLWCEPWGAWATRVGTSRLASVPSREPRSIILFIPVLWTLFICILSYESAYCFFFRIALLLRVVFYVIPATVKSPFFGRNFIVFSVSRLCNIIERLQGFREGM